MLKTPTPQTANHPTRQAAHSKEPWSYAFADKQNASHWSRGAGWQLWTGGEGYTGIGKTHSETDAERIVSCVNALEGIANPAAVKPLVEAAKALYAAPQGKLDDAILKVGRALSALDAPPKDTEEII